LEECDHWTDLDFNKRTLTVRHQIQRIRGELYEDDTKSRRMRVIPLRWQRLRQAEQRRAAGPEWQDSPYIFTTRTGRPAEPRNLSRSCTRIVDGGGLPMIRLHDTRHGCATLLLAAGVAQREAMKQMNRLLRRRGQR
jgi:integrase